MATPLRMTDALHKALGALADAPGELSGYAIRQRTGLASGTLHPLLARLEAAELVTARWETEQEWNDDGRGRPRRKYYTITPAGRDLAEQESGADPHGRRTAYATELEQTLRTRLADAFDTFADHHYPETVFTPGSTQPDGIAGNAMRHAYHQAARMIRDGWPDSKED